MAFGTLRQRDLGLGRLQCAVHLRANFTLSPIPEMWATLSLLTWHSNITFLSSSGQNSKLVIHIGPNGENDGKNQVFLTPGLIVGRIPLFWRFKALIGVGYQFAASDVHPSYQSNWILTMRLPF
jgi:hypothetical protein